MLKNILQLYTLSLDMDEEGNFHLTTINKRSKSKETFIDKAYSVVIRKAHGHMLREIKKDLNL